MTRHAGRRMLWLLLAWLALAPAAPAQLSPREMLPDARQEARARALSRELRCLVCQNQTIDESAAEIARDMRRLVRERVAAGDSDRDVLAFVVARYGDFARMTPAFTMQTAALWGLPFLVLLAGGLGAARYLVRGVPPPSPLTAAEQARLRQLERDA